METIGDYIKKRGAVREAEVLREQHIRNIEMDRHLRVMLPGKRRSAITGRWYYERRANRSDVNPHTRL